MKASIITVGDELLIGQVVNTNAAWLGTQCSGAGIEVESMVTTGDSPAVITREIMRATEIADAILVTGGLGPTHDDITREAVASAFGKELVLNHEVLAAIQARFDRRGFPMPEMNRSQALIPVDFEAIPNALGSAPGLFFEDSRGAKTVKVAVFPGVPHEMKAMFLEDILSRLVDSRASGDLVTRTILTAGIGESTLAERLGDMPAGSTSGLSVAFLPGIHSVRIRLTANSRINPRAGALLTELEAHLHRIAGEHIYGYGEDRLEEVVGRLLIAAGKTVATAESCTGGLVASRLTDISGSSSYVLGGVVAYSNASKARDLGVSELLLEKHGAVSKEVAMAMAEGVCRRFGTDFGLSLTGIMGPGGGSDEKPVGTVWIALACSGRGQEKGEFSFSTKARLLQLGGDRERNKLSASTAALDLLRRHLTLP